MENLRKPVVAVYVSNKVFNNLVKQQDKKYLAIRELAKANEIAQTTLYFFSYGGVDFENYLITGIFHDGTNWVLRKFPFPDVFMDRFNMTTRVRKKHLNYVRKKFDALGIKKINPRHDFDKWELYELLTTEPLLRRHLPYTRRYLNKFDLKEMLLASNKVYIKARSGYGGRDIMSVRKLPDGKYEYNFYRNQVVTKTIQSLDAVGKKIESFFLNKDLIIQEAIDLLCIDESLIDLRGEVQRNGCGDLELTAIPFRVGRKGAPVTTRGTSYPFEQFCRETLNLEAGSVAVFKKQVEQFLKAVYKCVEDRYGTFGELGIDLGLDTRGKLWFIECNAKSGKVSLSNAADKDTIIKAFLNPLQYAKYIYLTDTAKRN